MKKPSRISPKDVLQSSLINTVLHLLEKNNKGDGGLILLTLFPENWQGGTYLRGGVNKGFTISLYSLLYLLELFALTASSSHCRKDQFAVL